MEYTIAINKQKKADLEVVVKHIKDDLFAKVKFIYDPKVDLAVGGKIYKDYKEKCRDQIGGMRLAREGRDTHLEAVWTDGLTKHIQKNALAQKRSAVCTVMQNKFAGKSEYKASSMTRFTSTNIVENQICVIFVQTRNVSCCPSKASSNDWRIRRRTMSSTSSSTRQRLGKSAGNNAWTKVKNA
jgi:hypothetical protein